MSIVNHLEKYLGKIQKGWRDDNSEKNIQIVSFDDCPGETISTFVSLGMSENILELTNGKTVRQELLFCTYSLAISELIVSLLMSFSEAIVSRGKAVLRGEVISLPPELRKRMGFSAIYFTIPVFFDDDFSDYDNSLPSTVIVWALPIHQSEMNYIADNGWESFEDMLEEKDPDLCSLQRKAII